MARIPLVIKDSLAQRLDRAVALLSLQTGERVTRTSLLVRALETEVERIEAVARASSQRVSDLIEPSD